jgi:CHAD domain-containing protein/CYTH domain-containing protein
VALPDDLLLRTPEEAARRIALGFLDDARDAAKRLRAAKEDETALHDFRVAIRRLRATSRAYRQKLAGSARKKDRAALKDLLTATGEGRDAEVALEWLTREAAGLYANQRLGYEWLVRRLEERKRAGYEAATADVLARFDRFSTRFARRLGTMTLEVRLERPLPKRTWAGELATQIREHAAKLASILGEIHDREDVDTAHAARIATKRLRYLAEPARQFEPAAKTLVKKCKALQDGLGDLNDAAVLRREIAAAQDAAAEERAQRLHDLALADDEERMRDEVRRTERPGLVVIAERIDAHHARLFDALRREWLDDRAAALTDDAAKLARALEARAAPLQEIERKYLLDALPTRAADAPSRRIEQGWLPGKRLRERLRRVTDDRGVSYLRTVKAGSGVARIEIEEETTREVFDALWPLTEGCRVIKRRYVVEDKHATWEVDVFEGRELALAEVELESEDETPELPAWLAPHVVREVTDEPAFVNLNLAS